jgi:hypothetical protein
MPSLLTSWSAMVCCDVLSEGHKGYAPEQLHHPQLHPQPEPLQDRLAHQHYCAVQIEVDVDVNPGRLTRGRVWGSQGAAPRPPCRASFMTRALNSLLHC